MPNYYLDTNKSRQTRNRIVAIVVALLLIAAVVISVSVLYKSDSNNLAAPTLQANAENGKTTTVTRGDYNELSFVINASYGQQDVQFDYNWTVDNEAAFKYKPLDNTFTIEIASIGADEKATVTCEVRATDGENFSAPATWTHTVIVEESRAPDIESEIRVSKNIDLSNFKVEPDTQDQGGSSFVGLGDKSTGFENSDGLEIALQDESNFVPNDNMEGHGTFVKMSIFFDREQAADKVGGSITYFFAKHEGQYYVVVQSTSSHKNEIIDNATNKTQAVAEFEDTDEAHKYELGDSISNISFRAKYGEKNTIALKVNGETKTISDIFEHANGKGSINRLRSIWLNGLTTIKGNTLMESLKVSAPLA